ncbi:MAG: GNAT family N-acetyltransferase [Chitinophagaceae bacterium]
MIVELRNKKEVFLRTLVSTDAEQLYQYLTHLSSESLSRFGPHAFDKEAINNICSSLNPATKRYIAIDTMNESIIAYMLIQQGMIESDEQRYANRLQYFDTAKTVTFAPSVADEWQSAGLGTLMNNAIESELKKKEISKIVLWGGVQADNLKAVNYYKKLNYQIIDMFWHDGKNNYDMVKDL